MPRRFHALGAAALAAALATSSVVSGVTAMEPRSAAWLTDIAESAELAGPILARGVLVDRSGRPAGGRVAVVAWPPPEVMATLEVGDAVKTAHVAKATVGSDGTFALRVDPTVPLAEFMMEDGTVNFELMGETTNGWTFFSFPRTLESNPSLAWVDARRPDLPGESAPPEVLKVTLRPGPTELRPSDAAPAPLPASEKACANTVVATYNGRLGIVGEVYSGPHSTADFQYSSGSSSTLGVGFSVTGQSGTFSASGTSGISSLNLIDYPTQAANKKTVFQTSFGYQKIHMQVYGSMGCVDQGYRVRPYQWQGAMVSYAAATAPTANYCQAAQAGGSVTKETGTAITFTNGLAIASVIGIDLSTRTGFNTATKIRHAFSSAGQLCGSNNYWPDAARIVGK